MAVDVPKVALETITKILSGATPSKARADYWGDGTPWVSAKDMKKLRLSDAEDHITSAGLENGSRLAPAHSTLILTRGMTLLNDIPICKLACDVAFNQDIKAIVPCSQIDPTYLTYALLASKLELLSMVELAGHGTGRLPTDLLKAFNIPLPSKGEQRAIAHILETLDDKIELNQRMNETLDSIAKVIFKSWFVDFDPVSAKAEGRDTGLPKHIADLFPDSFEDSELGDIPKGWEIRGLDKIAEFLNGLALQKYPPMDGDSLPVIKIAQLRAGNTDKADKASIGIDPNYIVADGDVLFSWSGTLQCVLWAGGLGALNQHLFKVSSNDFPKWFYYLWIHEHLAAFRHIAAGKATTMGHIQRHHLSDAKVVIPNWDVFELANCTMAPIIDRIIHHKIESRTLAALRDTMLPKLISGDLRVKGSDRFMI